MVVFPPEVTFGTMLSPYRCDDVIFGPFRYNLEVYFTCHQEISLSLFSSSFSYSSDFSYILPLKFLLLCHSFALSHLPKPNLTHYDHLRPMKKSSMGFVGQKPQSANNCHKPQKFLTLWSQKWPTISPQYGYALSNFYGTAS